MNDFNYCPNKNQIDRLLNMEVPMTRNELFQHYFGTGGGLKYYCKTLPPNAGEDLPVISRETLSWVLNTLRSMGVEDSKLGTKYRYDKLKYCRAITILSEEPGVFINLGQFIKAVFESVKEVGGDYIRCYVNPYIPKDGAGQPCYKLRILFKEVV